MTHPEPPTVADKRLLDRLARVEGQVRALRRMLEGGRSCEDVLTQLLAARSGLESAGVLVLEQHLQDCILADQDVTPATMERLHEALRRWARAAASSG
jgi:CsoR family transcriptional regulator, copper-sensing transcriptional repressor